MERVIGEQRQLLEEISAQASQTALRHGTIPPAARAAEPEVTPPAASERKTRRQRQASNVIDITEAEILAPQAAAEGGLKMPRIRPVQVLPPQVRIL